MATDGMDPSYICMYFLRYPSLGVSASSKMPHLAISMPRARSTGWSFEAVFFAASAYCTLAFFHRSLDHLSHLSNSRGHISR